MQASVSRDGDNKVAMLPNSAWTEKQDKTERRTAVTLENYRTSTLTLCAACLPFCLPILEKNGSSVPHCCHHDRVVFSSRSCCPCCCCRGVELLRTNVSRGVESGGISPMAPIRPIAWGVRNARSFWFNILTNPNVHDVISSGGGRHVVRAMVYGRRGAAP